MSLPQRIEGFIAETASCDSLAALRDMLEKYVNKLGAERFAYWLVLPPSGVKQNIVCLTNYDHAWQDRYREEGYASFDLVGRYAAKSVIPFNWDHIQQQPDLTPKQKQIFGEGGDAGLSSGCSIPIHGPGRSKAVFSVASRDVTAAFQKLFSSYKHELQLMANYAHEKVMQIHAEPEPDLKPALTPREIEILTWMSRGKSRWEAGVILGISEDTVRVHLEKTRHKLGASNTVHAISLAIKKGLLRD